MADTEYVPVSALQHYLYCPRQCALIHVEQQWAENRHTAEGGLMHQRVDKEGHQTRAGIRTVSAMPLSSDRLGLTGVADVVEIEDDDSGLRVTPIEYKRGRPKGHRADEVQLCAQALCLEEMFGTCIHEGFLFYGKTRRRNRVRFDNELRGLAEDIAARTRTLILAGTTPPPRYEAALCDRCSLREICQPQRLSRRRRSVARWLARQIEE